MTTASIVAYKTNVAELQTVLRCVVYSSVEQVYVVDNSPTNDLQPIAEQLPKVVYLWRNGNIGYGSAHNIAIKKAIKQGAKYHVVINPDIEFEEGTIEKLTQFMDANPDVGQVMPRVVYPNGDLQRLCKLLPTPMDLIGRRFFPSPKRNARFEMSASGYDKTMEVPFLSGCFMFLRVDALVKVEGFDDDFFMYCEDIDLCRKISIAGYKTIYYPEVTIVHAHKKESFKSKAMLKVHIRSAIKYFNKWGWVFDTYRTQTNKKATQQYK